MFTRDEPLANVVRMTATYNIMEYVDINLQMDRLTMNYYYEVDIDELSNSKMPKEEYEQMKQDGWTYDPQKNKLILYIKSNE